MHPSPPSSHTFSWVGGVWWEHLWSTLLADFKYIVDVIAQSLGCVQVFVTPWTAAFQASLSLISQSLPKFTSIKSVMPSNHLILCCPLLLSALCTQSKVTDPFKDRDPLIKLYNVPPSSPQFIDKMFTSFLLPDKACPAFKKSLIHAKIKKHSVKRQSK